MKNRYFKISAVLLLLISFTVNAQENNDDDKKSNIQTFTPSKLINKGQWDIKFFKKSTT